MKSNQNEEVQKLAEYTATRMLDSLLQGKSVIDYTEELTAREIYGKLKEGPTKNLVFNNLDLFDTCLNNLIYNRIDYLCAEGLVIFDENQCYRIPTEAEMKEFLTVE